MSRKVRKVMKLTKAERFERISEIIKAADKEMGEGARPRDVFDVIGQDDIWKILFLSTQPENYDFNQERDRRIGAMI